MVFKGENETFKVANLKDGPHGDISQKQSFVFPLEFT